MNTPTATERNKNAKVPPRNLDALRTAITESYPNLSKRLQQIAHFALDNSNDMALETVAVIASRAGVQPSSLIRFANTFGFSGFSEMQRVFQSALLERVPSYNTRIRQSIELQTDAPLNNTSEILQEFCAANIVSLRHLQDVVPDALLEQALEMLSRARVVHVLGLRRSFPVAAYLAYALSRSERNAHLLAGVGGMLTEQSSLIGPDDVLIAISATPYAQETVAIVEAAAAQGVPIIAITDSALSPIALHAKLSFCIHDAELRGFRSLTATLCLAQTLAVGLALKAVRSE
ncbi:MAG: MurR/RpiR family transcriptional regulator [Pseudogulbenkiania sp.]|nr:MurR/RpiR family transcriptional regulator [Pseudogulbenkiania sp.]